MVIEPLDSLLSQSIHIRERGLLGTDRGVGSCGGQYYMQRTWRGRYLPLVGCAFMRRGHRGFLGTRHEFLAAGAGVPCHWPHFTRAGTAATTLSRLTASMLLPLQPLTLDLKFSLLLSRCHLCTRRCYINPIRSSVSPLTRGDWPPSSLC